MRCARESFGKGRVGAVTLIVILALDIRDVGIAILFIVFAGVGLSITGLLFSRMSGWDDLADHYRAKGKFFGDYMDFRWGWFRYWIHARYSLTVGADKEGIYLAFAIQSFPFIPPLFIPWSDITVSRSMIWFFDCFEYRFRQAPDVYIKLSESTGQTIARWGGQKFTGVLNRSRSHCCGRIIDT
jgi:hypothetical protein